MQDKGYGMGVHVPHLASPVTGAPEAAPGTGYTFRENEDNLARWRGWWNVANKEQLVSFVAITIVTIAIMSLLAYSTVLGAEAEQHQLPGGRGQRPDGHGGHLVRLPVLDHQGDLAVRRRLGIVDFTRLVADVLKVGYLRDNQTWSESRIYFLLVWCWSSGARSSC